MVLHDIRIDSIEVEVRNRPGHTYIPRSLLHGVDDLKVISKQFSLPCEITLRVLDWKAEELGLA